MKANLAKVLVLLQLTGKLKCISLRLALNSMMLVRTQDFAIEPQGLVSGPGLE